MSETPNPIQLQKYLGGVDYPASRDELIETARKNGAPDDIVDALTNAGADSFDSPTAVSSAVSGS
ncbi:hypothetical protein C5B96_03405 [Subtercola sp. Z020]|uniref:DUF2795 domain-containing protein n=1 Tax=Subtercola sp. Z020 TaxID=2080582 RepID=UPI000CE8957A|nr:DUF2795 domain-containing protein [Subtercola sp. Z020]PPF87844.1 hypothetical protein C5B96_03405 [Subtercola sp. Z020]